MATTIVALQSDNQWELGTARVYTSETLGTVWTERPYLYVDVLRLQAAPQIDEAILRYEYGDFQHREPDLFGGGTADGIFTPLSLDNNYVKIEILDVDPDPQAVIDEDATDEEKAAAQPTVLKTWYGVIEVDERKHAREAEQPLTETGSQILYAFGLLRLLDRTVIQNAYIKEEGGTTLEIGRGLPFNRSVSGPFWKRGNRTFGKVQDYDGYLFDWTPFPDHQDGAAITWLANEAVEYLLEYHEPKDQDDVSIGSWSLTGQTQALQWYDITVETDRRSVKQVLDALIDRRRLVSYVVEAEEVDNAVEVSVRVFTFNDESIDLGEGNVIDPSETLVSLTAESTPVVSDMRIRRLATQLADKVRVEGELITSTFTATHAATELKSGWDTDIEDDYVTLAGSAEENTRERSTDKYQNVFSLFILDNNWDKTVSRESDAAEFHVVIPVEDLPDEIDDDEVAGLFSSDGQTEHAVWWHMGHPFLRYTLLQDVNSKDYRHPFALLPDDTIKEPSSSAASVGTKYVYAHKANYEGSERKFACHLRLLSEQPGIRLQVTRPGGAQLIGAGRWATYSAGPTPEALNPDIGANNALDYDLSLKVTASVEWDHRVFVEVDTGARTEGQGRTIHIVLPDSRLDFVIPGTVTDLDKNSELVESDGQVLRDDRPRMRNIANAAAEWYGTVRQALTITQRDVYPKLTIGDLITELAIGNTTETIKTVVTGVSFDFANGRSSIVTSFTDADFR